ncbi:MAG: polymer-forming cytoskeletal protein [Desulfovibrio sp.]|jgi:cytoskeletal protein CcmA (bactofilin family)|nr:polymer-forming cytoskeletal protein [Desulfovibrio sp.]
MKWFSRIFSETAETDNTSGELNAFLGTGTTFTGHLSFEGSVRIDGHFLGTISATGTLILGREALVKGEVEVASLNANGTLIGTVRASRHAHLHEHAVFDGHLITPALGMDQGAVLNGTIEMPNKNPRRDPAELGDVEMPVLPTHGGRAVSVAATPAVGAAAPETEDES